MTSSDSEGSLSLDFAWLDLRFRKPLMAYFRRRTGDVSESEDLTQQVFLRLMNSEAGRPVRQVEGYVFTIAANLLKDHFRNTARRRPAGTISIDSGLVDEVVRAAMETRSAERVMVGRESLAEVLASLGELGDLTRDIFILFRLENMKQSDIAARLGLGRSTVEKHVMKASLHLARRYGSGRP